MSDAELKVMGLLRGTVLTLLDVQRGRLLQGQELEWISFEELQALQAEFREIAGLGTDHKPAPPGS